MTSPFRKGFAISPEKDQCTPCGRVIVAGPMGLSHHLARHPLCSKDYEAQLNQRRQQVLFPSMLLSSTVSPVDNGRQSEADFEHTIGGSSDVNKLLALPSEYASEDILNKDGAEAVIISDINTGALYLKTYDALIKNVEEDMLLPCTLAINKTRYNVRGGGRLLLEPIVISYGLT